MKTSAPPIHFNSHLESLRGIAAWSVVLAHGLAILKVDGSDYLWGIPFAQQTPDQMVIMLISAVFNARSALVVFFVLSGYVLSLSILRRSNLSLLNVLPGYLIRRFFRLIPPMWASIVIVAIVAHVASVKHLELSSWFLSHEPPSLIDIVRNFALIDFVGNPVTWTMYIEALGSVALPFLCLPAQRYGLKCSLGCLFLLLCMAVVTRPALEFQYLACFQVGVILASHEKSYRVLTWPLLCVAAGVMLFAVDLLYTPHMARGWVMGWVANMVGAYLIIGAIIGGRAKGVMTFLGTKSMRKIGRISYSIYLFQFAVLFAMTPIAVKFGVANFPWLWGHFALAAVCVGATIGLAALGYEWIEKPSIWAGRRVAAMVGTRLLGSRYMRTNEIESIS